MTLTKGHRVIFLAVCCVLLTMTAPVAFSQDSTQPARSALSRDDETNLDTQALSHSGRPIVRPRTQDAPGSRFRMKGLHESLTFKHYSLAGTFVNRVRNGGRLDVSGWRSVSGSRLSDDHEPEFSASSRRW